MDYVSSSSSSSSSSGGEGGGGTADGDGVALSAVIKDCESKLDSDGLDDFYHSYFNQHPIYQDSQWKLHQCMSHDGQRKIGILGLVKAVWKAKSRWNQKKIDHSPNLLRTDPWMIGGVMIFDKKGNLVFSVEETVGQELDMDRIARAVQGARNMNATYHTDDNEDEDAGSDDFTMKDKSQVDTDTSSTTQLESSNGSDMDRDEQVR